jgi:hypothetical protein
VNTRRLWISHRKYRCHYSTAEWRYRRKLVHKMHIGVSFMEKRHVWCYLSTYICRSRKWLQSCTWRKLLRHRPFSTGVTNTLEGPRMRTSPKHQLLFTQQLLRIRPTYLWHVSLIQLEFNP